MATLDGQPRFFYELVDQPIARIAYIFLGPGELCCRHHLLSHDLGVFFNQCFKVLTHGVFRSLSEAFLKLHFFLERTYS